MARFLHLADVHLGFDRYNNPKRTTDFFHALEDALVRYAIDPKVDFVVIAGDLFEHKVVQPAILSQALLVLDLLKKAEIPAIAIEGNHDHRPYGSRSSWLRYLAEWYGLILLEPEASVAEGDNRYQPWDPETHTGSYIDLDCGVRILGSCWYGSAAPQMIRLLAADIRALPPGPEHTVMLFHHGVEGQIARYSGALRYEDLLPLREAGVNYLALGHIHKYYELENWVFNPGSVEANSIAEGQDQAPRGVLSVELKSGQKQPQVTLQRDYLQRPIVRLRLETRVDWSPADLEAAAIATVEQAIATGTTQEAIVELRISGSVAFPRSEFDTRSLQAQLHQQSQALIFNLRYDVSGQEFASPVLLSEQVTPEAIEASVFADQLAEHQAYRDRCDQLTPVLQDLKDRLLRGEEAADLYRFLETAIAASLT
ncbi:metallophosphoesterase family protein [Synechococcus elongatus]|uniref:Nuclease SbcCD subunit D n=1 Tax=Synechococcus elongatus (strain ATCC 33912 / PCC 7942 / FACHB-805) TaxID=1140 RepID=Q31NT7_SYNE7|nr:metallophosphoesterase [Synechococcus elongatus]ABB57282.1 DNA repair protein RAD32-like [Synechococcus elongatus PCC 7942 = FACHB-805]AJD58204.1 DNA repair protein [Synechococcus elongatus UTEX 2973]MBD2587689.1 metallophosphoesterase [Synechococcus elongatus FACHB-242]MBD2688532.1 metallophosphoesterase [Synechococcus elongatus FACHB-1061]MBD2707603.1 metallophosphoesterase [Synechococcus elongatus PCC 7942 = FACHB-805]